MSGVELGLIEEDIAKGLIDEAIARQRQLPPPSSPQQAAAYARLRAEIAHRLSAQGHAAGVFDLLQPYDTVPSRARLPVAERALVSLRLGEAYCATLNYPSALSLLNEAIRVAGLASDRKLEADAECSLGLVYFHLGEYTISRESLQQAYRYYLRVGDLRGEARCNLYFGMIANALGEFETGIENYNRVISIAEKLQDSELWAEATVNLGSSYLLQGRLRKAVALYETALERGRGNGKLTIYTYNNLAHSLILCGNWSRAQQLLETSLVLARESQDDHGEALALCLFGMLYTLTDRLQTARHTLVSSIELCRQIRSKECEAFALVKLGQVYMKTAEYEQASIHLTSALELALSINCAGLAVEAELALAQVALDKGQLQKVEEFLALVQKRLVKQPNIVLEGYRLYLYGKLEALRQGHAETPLSHAIEVFESISMPLEKGFCLLERAKVLMRSKERGVKAAADLERAAELFHKIGASYLLPSVLQLQKQLSVSRKGTNLNLVKEKLYEERRQMHSLLKACRSRESLLKEAVEGLRRHVQADLVAVYEVNNGECSLISSTSDSVLLKSLQERLVLESTLKGTTGWVKGRSIDEPIYIDTLQLTPEKKLAFLIWMAPQKLVNRELIRALLDIVGELIALAVQQEGRRVEFSAVDRGRLKSFKDFPELVYAGRKMAELVEQILRVHSSDLTVLITSESGTGKDLVARAIHAASERRDKPFLPFNCTATPHEIVEAQLFGYRKGAFTGANFDYEGVIRAANGGTLLLDEIGDLHLSVQPKLLRFLQEGEIQPIGYPRPIKVDVRIIASTNRDLESMVERGEFREDLYHRLNIIRLSIPPLRQRREEIRLLAQFFLRQAAQRTGKELVFSSEVLQLLEAYNWPGNVRQLKNEIERIAAFAGRDDTIEKFHLSPEIVQGAKSADRASEEGVQTGRTLEEILVETEREVITRTLKQFRGNIRRSAALLGVSRKGLYDKIKRLKIRHSAQ